MRLRYFVMGLICGMTLMGVAMGEDWEIETTIYKVCNRGYCEGTTSDRRVAEERYETAKRGFHVRGDRVALVEVECRPRVISEAYYTESTR